MPDATPPGLAIYLSHFLGDTTLANRVRQGLQATQRTPIRWTDVEASPGVDALRDLTLVMSRSQVVVVLVSEDLGYGTSDLLSTEIELARKGGLPIVAAVVGSTAGKGFPTGLLGFPFFELDESSWDADIRQLADHITELASKNSDLFRPARMLPPPTDPFVGRVEHVKQIEAAIHTSIKDPTGPNAIQIIGPDGVGKTALAVRVAHGLSDLFPDGQLYAQLNQRASVLPILRSFLEAMGVDRSRMPSTLTESTALYRSMLADKRVLIVLDDVADPRAVTALVPPHYLGVTLLVGRVRLPVDASVIELNDGLSRAEALTLLRATSGADFVDEDPQRAEDLVTAANGSPLALALIGAQGRRRDATALASLTAGLRALPEGAARQVLMSRVYQSLPSTQQRIFRRLGALPGSEFEPGFVAALADTTVDEITGPMRALVDAALVDPAGEGRYRLSEAVSTFAAERLVADEPESERQAATRRAVRWIATKVSFRPETPITRDFWTIDDKLGYAPYADAVASFIQHRGTLPPLTIGITAPWGAGKTSLMRMVQHRLDPRTDTEAWMASELRLSEAARRVVGQGRVTNLDLLRQTSEPEEREDDAEDLSVQTPHTRVREGWRPTVWFNPWMYQSGEQIWAGLAHEIISQVTGRLSASDRERFWLALNLRRVDRSALRRRIYRSLVERFLPWLISFAFASLAALIVFLIAVVVPPAAHALRVVASGLVGVGGAAAVGGALTATVRFLHSKASGPFGSLLRAPSPLKSSDARSRDGTFDELTPDPAYESRLGFLHLVHTDMRRVLDLVATRDRPLVVFVDDLDRCSPSAVVQVIEAINLFLAGEFPNCVFVLAMDPAVVAAHLEAVYKDLAAHPTVAERSTLGWRFLEKIVQLPLSLPPVTVGGLLISLLERAPTSGARTAAAARVGPIPHRASALTNLTLVPTADNAELATGNVDVDWDLRVRRIEEGIRSRRPTIETLAVAALEAQADVMAGSDAMPLAETSEAMNRVLVELYTDDEAKNAIMDGVPGLVSNNPREIKRFVNLFRFFTFIAQQQQLQGYAGAAGPEIAKIAVLAIRWPHLLSVLARRSGEGAATVLSKLEASAKKDGNWTDELRDAGLTAEGEPLRGFLTTQPAIADAASRLL
jgi:hypothetical protein